MHSRVRHPVDKVVLQGRLVAAVGVADSHSEEDEVVAGGEDDGLRPETSWFEGRAVDTEV
jgi:hypothetical protein